MENKNKKILLSALSLLTALSLAACNQSAKADTTPGLTSSTSAVTAASAEAIIFQDQAVAPTVTKSTLAFKTTDGAATQKGDVITITKPGTYQITGNSADGQIIVDVDRTIYNNGDTDKVTLVLNGVNIFSKNSAPIYVKNIEDKVVIELAKGTVNYITDGESRTDTSVNGAIYSADDLNIKGEGTLLVRANYEDGIASKNDIKIKGGTIEVTAADDGIRGKDSVTVEAGTLTLQAAGDGIKSTETDDEAKGYVKILGGTLRIKADHDGIQAEADLTIEDGNFEILTLQGSNYVASTSETNTATDEETTASTSYKALKAGKDLNILGGNFNLDASDDGLHANGDIKIQGGDFKIASADDGVHADGIATLNGGNMTISKSVEGIEAAQIIVNDGYFKVVSSDDGLNASDGSASAMGPGGMGQNRGNVGDQPSMRGNRPSMAPPVNSDGSASTTGQAERNGNLPPEPPTGGQGPSFDDGNRPAAPPTEAPPVTADGAAAPNASNKQDANAITNTPSKDLDITINGGALIIEAGGDGIDSNGSLTFNGGTVVVTNYGQGDAALDAETTMTSNGGTILAVGSAGMAQGANNADSKQASILVNASVQAGEVASITDQSGNTLITFAPGKNIQSVYFSSKELKIGESYNILTGGSYTGGTSQDGIYTGGKYTGGTTTASATAATMVY